MAFRTGRGPSVPYRRRLGHWMLKPSNGSKGCGLLPDYSNRLFDCLS